MIIDGDAAPVVDDSYAAVSQQGDFGASCEAGHGLIHGVVDYFPNQMVKPAGTCRSDVHAGPFAYGFKTLEDGDVSGVVGRSTGFGAGATSFGAGATGGGTGATGAGAGTIGFGTGTIGFGTGTAGFGAGATGFGSATTGFGAGLGGATGTGVGSSGRGLGRAASSWLLVI